MAIGSSLGVTLPTQGANAGTWGTDLNTEIAKIVTAVEAQVPITAIDFSTDVDLNDNGFTETKMIAFTKQSSVTNLNAAYFDTAGDFYVRDGENNAIQITNAGTLNNASAGGLGDSGGDYGTGGITFDWDGTQYNAQGTSSVYVPVRMSKVLLHDNSGNQITFETPSISSNFTMTLPTAQAGGATTILQSNASGAMSYSNSFSTDITLTSSAEIKHGERTLVIAADAGQQQELQASQWNYSSGTGIYDAILATDILVFPIPLLVGDRVKSIKLGGDWGGTGATKTIRLRSLTLLDKSTYLTNQSTTFTDDDDTVTTWDVTDYTLTTSDAGLFFVVEMAHVSDFVVGLQVTYDRP